MKTIALFGNSRASLGKVSTKELRNEGRVPCVLYGGTDNVQFSVYEPDFKLLVYTPNTYKVKLDVEGKIYNQCRAMGITLFTVSHRKSLWDVSLYFQNSYF